MANGDCPVGATNSANIASQGREIGEMKGILRDHEQRIEKNTLAVAHNGWRIGAAVGLVLMVGIPLVNRALAVLLPLP